MNLRSCSRWMTLLTWLLHIASSESISSDAVENSSPSFVLIFSPRMDFDQWKPLTGRGDPLRNDPTYDYEPPVLERVHYWADDTRLEREHYPDRKSEVLMLGVSSRKPSVVPRPAVPPRKHHRPPPPKYEDFTYKFSDNYPMTILVPPPPPPPGHKPSLYILTDDKIPVPTASIIVTDSTSEPKVTTTTPDLVTSYAVQESNLIYQSSTTNQNWIYNYNQSQIIPKDPVSSDYAGWGPTTPFENENIANDTHNFIFGDHKSESNKASYSFYKPMFLESPPPRVTTNPVLLPTFVPTALPPIPSTISSIQTTEHTDDTTTESSIETQSYDADTTTEKIATYSFLPTPTPSQKTKPSIVDMLSPMMTMPMIPDVDRPEDHLYAHASDTVQVFKEPLIKEDQMKLEVMQTMQPPPFSKLESTAHHQPVHINPHIINNLIHDNPGTFTHDPYLNMRYTTPIITPSSEVNVSLDTKTTSEAPTLPMYLIIQGHSKVKTYGSKTKTPPSALSNDIPRLNETNEVKHLHPIKQKHTKNLEKQDLHRAGRAKNLKSLVDNGLGSIEIQETDIGIKYDVSDGSDVPVEIYRKGIVDTDDYHISSNNKVIKNRIKRQIDLDDLLPFDEDTLEEYVYNFFREKRNVTGITGLIAQAITSDSAFSAVEDLEEDEDEDNSGSKDR